MSNKPRICVALFHRGKHSLGDANRQRLGLAIYHWAILIRPKDMKDIALSTWLDVTDAIMLGPNGVDLNPTRDWRFRTRTPLDPLATGNFLAAVTLGKLPKGVTVDQVETLLAQVPLPRTGQMPEQHCATWLQEAIRMLQQAGYAERADLEEVMRQAMEEADNVMKLGPPSNGEDRFKPLTKRSQSTSR